MAAQGRKKTTIRVNLPISQVVQQSNGRPLQPRPYKRKRRDASEESKGDELKDKSGHLDGAAGMVDEDDETRSAQFRSPVYGLTAQELSHSKMGADVSADISGIPMRAPQEDSLQVSSLLPDRSMFNQVSGLDLSMTGSQNLGISTRQRDPLRQSTRYDNLINQPQRTVIKNGCKKIVPTVIEVFKEAADKSDGDSISSYKSKRGSSLDRKGY